MDSPRADISFKNSYRLQTKESVLKKIKNSRFGSPEGPLTTRPRLNWLFALNSVISKELPFRVLIPEAPHYGGTENCFKNM